MEWIEPAVFSLVAVVGFGFLGVCALMARIESCLVDIFHACLDNDENDWTSGLEDDVR
jgi:hypothetical protein